jgi:hypothetical protein
VDVVLPVELVLLELPQAASTNVSASGATIAGSPLRRFLTLTDLLFVYFLIGDTSGSETDH